MAAKRDGIGPVTAPTRPPRGTPPGGSPGGVPQPPIHQPRHRLAGGGPFGRIVGTVIASLRLVEVAELSLSTAGLTWLLLIHIARTAHLPAVITAALAGIVAARQLHGLMTRTAASELPASTSSGTSQEAR